MLALQRPRLSDHANKKYVYRETKQDLIRLNKIVIQSKDPGWTRKLLAYRDSNDQHPCVIRISDIFANFVFKHIDTASINTIICFIRLLFSVRMNTF